MVTDEMDQIFFQLPQTTKARVLAEVARQGNGPMPAVGFETAEQFNAAADRLKRVQILNRDALELLEGVLRADQAGDYLIYFDPPYLHSTRANRRSYRHEVDDAWHVGRGRAAAAGAGAGGGVGLPVGAVRRAV